MAKKTLRVGDIEVDEDTLYSAMEEAKLNESGPYPSLMSVLFMIMLAMAAWSNQWLPSRVSLVLGFLVVCVGVVISVIAPLLMKSRRRDLGLRAALYRRGINICVACGYNLQGLDGEITKCPECGSSTPDSILKAHGEGPPLKLSNETASSRPD
jgi:hypothetical protein